MLKLIDQIEHGLSEENISSYGENGFLHLKGLLTKTEINLLRGSVAKQINGLSDSETSYDLESLANQVWSGAEEIESGQADRFDLALYKAMIDHDDEARPIRDRLSSNNTNGMFFYDAAGWRAHEGIREVAFDSVLPSLCAQLLDTSYLNFWEDTTFVKTPNTAQRTAFHQDYAYFQIRGKKCCIVWIPLDPVTKENGAMQYVRGSHLWDKTYAPNMFITQTPLLDTDHPKLPDIENNPADYDIVTIEAHPGDVIIHDVMTIHGSGGNLSKTENRRAMSFRYCGDDIEYYDRPGAIPQPYIAKNLPDGSALLSKDYPLVWPRPYPEARLAPFFKNTIT